GIELAGASAALPPPNWFRLPPKAVKEPTVCDLMRELSSHIKPKPVRIRALCPEGEQAAAELAAVLPGGAMTTIFRPKVRAQAQA
ncbi:MAG TPA: hypothetical protein PK263_05490, partial [bacterium]|nr:hypothetical protein [bacterium]